MGTIFNTDIQIIYTIVKALDLANGLRPLKAIIATGDTYYDKLKEKYDDTKFKNILFVKTAPQIEILQRASLFITHNGMNSTSEATLWSAYDFFAHGNGLRSAIDCLSR